MEITIGGCECSGDGGSGVGSPCSAGSSCNTSRCEDCDRGETLLDMEDLPMNGISALRSASESHDELRGSDSDAECDDGLTPDASAPKLSCRG